MNTERNNITETISRPREAENILKLRLNTGDVIERIELFLRGARDHYSYNEEGNVIASKINYGEPKCNSLGVQSILSFVTSIVNSQSVQGNFDREDFEAYIEEAHFSLVKQIVINSIKWEISDEDIEPICDYIMLLIIPFISRTLNNEERKSYSETLKHVESSSSTRPAYMNFMGRGGF